MKIMKSIKFFFVLFIGALLHLVGNGFVTNSANPYEFSSFTTVAWVFFILYYCLLFSLAEHLSKVKWE